MRSSFRFMAIVVGLSVALGGSWSCAKKKKKDSSTPAAIVDGNFEKPISAASTLEIGHALLAGTKLVTKNEIAAADDPALKVFEAELYPKLKLYCAAGCHDVNAKPFASDAVSLAFETAKPYMTDNVEDSQMIKNIKASHNGTKPEWAAIVGPSIQKVAEAIP